MVSTYYKEDLGFYITTNSTSSKIAQIEKNPLATISIHPDKEINTAVAHVFLNISKNQRILDSAWSDDLQQLGFASKNDPLFCVILVTVNSVNFGKDTYVGKSVDQISLDKINKVEFAQPTSDLYKTNEIKELINNFSSMQNAHLITFNGAYHDDRIMILRYKEGFGLFTLTPSDTKKVQQIQMNENTALLIEDKEKNEQIVFDCSAHINTDPETKKMIWDYLLNQLHAHAKHDGRERVIIQFSIRRVFHHKTGSSTEILIPEPGQV
ncbi:MAG: hypothetical protein EZS28_016588 [Streblomastix strix]|uniref:General stress protein FMN-binding split barrel domain-containing protein n=1 Tax=Streblomastix strix TaxID=222440 RepID=A0A5J4VZ71_9EUKA|nr:MAG: hypothetical protein EZS28_016588 [Streblomastix strix]